MKTFLIGFSTLILSISVNAKGSKTTGLEQFKRGDQVMLTVSGTGLGVVSYPATIEEDNFNSLGTFKIKGHSAPADLGQLENFQKQDSIVLQDQQTVRVGNQVMSSNGQIQTITSIANQKIQTYTDGVYRNANEYELYKPQSHLVFKGRQVSVGDYVQFRYDPWCKLKTISAIANGRVLILPEDGVSSNFWYDHQVLIERVHPRLDQLQLEDGTTVQVGGILKVETWNFDPATKVETKIQSEVHIEKIAEGCLKAKEKGYFLPVHIFRQNKDE